MPTAPTGTPLTSDAPHVATRVPHPSSAQIARSRETMRDDCRWHARGGKGVGVGWRGGAWGGIYAHMHMRVPATRWNDEGVGLKRLRASLAALAPAAEATLGASLESVSGAVRGRHLNLGLTNLQVGRPCVCPRALPGLRGALGGTCGGGGGGGRGGGGAAGDGAWGGLEGGSGAGGGRAGGSGGGRGDGRAGGGGGGFGDAGGEFSPHPRAQP